MPAKSQTRREILKWLKHKGPQDATALADRLDVSAMAVRQHLYALHQEQLVESEPQPRPVGRPAKLWKLTAEAEGFFPDGHSDLTLDLLAGLRQAFGNEGITKLLEVRARRQASAYRERIPQRGALRKRLEALARVRTGEGYMAEVVAERDGSFLFVENHCSICAAATACSGLCAGELDVFRAVLGPETRIERDEHILAGDRRCTYRVRPTGRRSRAKSS